MSELVPDVRYAFRTIRARSTWIFVIVLTLGIGIGTTTSIFSILDAVILKPLPFREPERLVHVWEGGRGDRYQPGETPSFIYARPGSFYDWQARSGSFESMSAYRWRKLTLTSGDRAENLWGQDVLKGFFETLGAHALLGRTFSAEDYGPSASHLAILSYNLWADRFGKDPNIVGRVVSFDREAYEVVGVMDRGFFPTRDDPPDLWTPHWADAKERVDRLSWGLTVFARLRPGVSLAHAQSDLDIVVNGMAQENPKAYQNMDAVLVPVTAQLIGSTWKLFLLLAGAVAVLLLIACVNVANILLARAVDREREFSVRMALGATRFRLLRQLIIENSLIALFAAGLGICVAALGTKALIRLLPPAAHLSRLDTAEVNMPVLAFVSFLVLAVTLFVSLVPLARLSRTKPYEALKAESRGASAGRRKRRLGQIFVVSEFALSLVLLVISGLLVQSFRKLSQVDPGFSVDNLLALEIQVPQFRYGPYKFEAKNTPREQLYERLEQRLAAVPGIESVGLTAKLPLRHGFDPWALSVVGRPPEPYMPKQGEPYAPPTPGFAKHGETSIQRVSPAFLRTLGVRLVRGRFLEEQDVQNHPLVAVVNESFAQKFFPNSDAVGKQVIVDHTSWVPKLTIIGVVADFKMNSLDRKPFPEMFWSIRQTPPESIWVLARARTKPSLVAPLLREEIHAAEADLSIVTVEPMAKVIEDSLWRTRVAALLLGLLAGISLALAITGIYSVMSYSVSQRTKEMGIRLAFGARQRDISSLVLGETLRLAAVGTVLGCLSAVAAGRLIAQQLYGVTETDPATYLLSSFLLIVVALAGSYAPARRALRVDPMVTLQ